MDIVAGSGALTGNLCSGDLDYVLNAAAVPVLATTGSFIAFPLLENKTETRFSGNAPKIRTLEKLRTFPGLHLTAETETSEERGLGPFVGRRQTQQRRRGRDPTTTAS